MVECFSSSPNAPPEVHADSSSHLVFRGSVDRGALQFKCAFDHFAAGASLEEMLHGPYARWHVNEVRVLSLAADTVPLRPMLLSARPLPTWVAGRELASIVRLRCAAAALVGAGLVELVALASMALGLRSRPHALVANPSPYRENTILKPAVRRPSGRVARWHWLVAVSLVGLAVCLIRAWPRM